MGQTQSATKGPEGPQGPQGPVGPVGPEGPKGESVKNWADWIESDKQKFITAIYTNDAFKDSVKDKIATDIAFRNALGVVMRGDAAFRISVQNALISDTTFVNSVATSVADTGALKTSLITSLKADATFTNSIKGAKGDPGAAGAAGVSITEVENKIKSNGLWCANGSCILPTSSRIGDSLTIGNANLGGGSVYLGNPSHGLIREGNNVKLYTDPKSSVILGNNSQVQGVLSVGNKGASIQTNDSGDLIIRAGTHTYLFGSNGTVYLPGHINVSGNIESIGASKWSIDGGNDLIITNSTGNPSSRYQMAKNVNTSAAPWVARAGGY